MLAMEREGMTDDQRRIMGAMAPMLKGELEGAAAVAAVTGETDATPEFVHGLKEAMGHMSKDLPGTFRLRGCIRTLERVIETQAKKVVEVTTPPPRAVTFHSLKVGDRFSLDPQPGAVPDYDKTSATEAQQTYGSRRSIWPRTRIGRIRAARPPTRARLAILEP